MATFATTKQSVLDRINTLASSSSTTAEESIYLAKALREAAQDITFVWRGAWTATYAYVVGDVVQYDGNAYICINAHTAGSSFSSGGGSWQTMVVGGTKFWSGSTAPSGAEDGDLFLDTDNEKLYHQVSGSWSLVTDLGGNIWTSGATVPANSVGEDGDFFFKTGSNEIYSRTSGTWTLLVNVTPTSMTNAEVKTAYEANADTNEFSDAEQTKLSGIASGADNVGTGTAGQVLKTDSAGTGIEWGTDGGLPSGGTVGQVVTNTAAGAGNWADVAAGGKIINISQATDTTFRTSAAGSTALECVRITVTSTAADSKFLLAGNCGISHTSGHSGVGFILGTSMATSNLIYTPSQADSSGGTNGWYGNRFSTGSYHDIINSITYYYDPGSAAVGSTYTFVLVGLGYSGMGTLKTADGSGITRKGMASITVQEVAQ